jgi:hypothetical protein
MNAETRITIDANKLHDALACFPCDRSMLIGGREPDSGETIERRSPAHGGVVTRVPPRQRGRRAARHAAFEAVSAISSRATAWRSERR